MSKSASGLVEYCKAQLGKPYWYGTFGQTSTAALYFDRKAMYPNYYTADNFMSQLGQRVHDCVGLIKGYLWSATPTSTPVYTASEDVNVPMLYNRCTERGSISAIPEIPGVCVFMASMEHVGVYIGNGEVIEARGHAWGVVKTKLKDRGWAFWGKPKYIDYSNTSANNNTVNTKPNTETKPNENTTVDNSFCSLAKRYYNKANEVIDGKYSTGEERVKMLEKEGYDPYIVQAIVNHILK